MNSLRRTVNRAIVILATFTVQVTLPLPTGHEHQ